MDAAAALLTPPHSPLEPSLISIALSCPSPSFCRTWLMHRGFPSYSRKYQRLHAHSVDSSPPPPTPNPIQSCRPAHPPSIHVSPAHAMLSAHAMDQVADIVRGKIVVGVPQPSSPPFPTTTTTTFSCSSSCSSCSSSFPFLSFERLLLALLQRSVVLHSTAVFSPV